MPAIQLTPAQRKEHRAAAHHLDPVVLIGAEGLTPAVRKETDAALNAHGLIKVRVFSDDRASRDTLLATLADELGAAPIQHIGKLLVLWRPVPPKEKAVREDRKAGPKVVKVFHGSGYSQLVQLFKETFRVVKPLKPKASRDKSSETSMPDRLGAMSETTTSAGRPATSASSWASTASSRKSPCRKLTPSTGSMGRMSIAMMVPSSSPTAAPAGDSLRRTYWLQAPGALPRSTTSWPGLISPRVSSISLSL